MRSYHFGVESALIVPISDQDKLGKEQAHFQNSAVEKVASGRYIQPSEETPSAPPLTFIMLLLSGSEDVPFSASAGRAQVQWRELGVLSACPLPNCAI